MSELIHLKKNTNNDQVEERAIDEYITSLEIITGKGLQAAFSLTRLLKGLSPYSFAK